ncbi:MAG: ATP-binding protein [Candidatus Cloacimonadales bacterium]|nr:ATP-binding protein [Candidatus Cloacimonadales bacterium]
MKHKIKNTELEKRIFISYFLITFFLVILLLLIEWQVASWGINLYEETNMKSNLTEFDIALNNESLRMLGAVSAFTDLDQVIKAAVKKDSLQIGSIAKADLDNLTICDRERNIWYGIQWGLINKYLPQIYQRASQNKSGSFVASYGKRSYLISFSPCDTKTDSSELLSIFIVSKKIELENFNLRIFHKYALLPYEDELNFSNIPEIVSFSNRIMSSILLAQETKQSTVLKKMNLEYAVALSIFYDLQDNPSGFFLVVYQRFVNSFIQQSILVFVLILLASTLVMVTFFGNWFSRSILAPVKNVSSKMKEIASNPADLEILEKQYSGVLGDMVDSFNVMNIALANHSKSLLEYKIITDNIDTGIFWLDDNLNIQLCNPSFLKITDSPNMDEIIGENLSEILGLKLKIKEKIIEGNNTFSSLKISTKTGNQKFVILNIRAELIKDNTRFFGTITDITKETSAIKAKETLEMELIKSNKLAEIGRNVEGIVHNLNSPLNSILGYSQLIKKGDKSIKDIDKIIEAGINAAHIVKGLLDKVKKSNASMVHPIDVNDLIEHELDLCNHNLFFKHYVILEKNLEKDLPVINAVYGDISLCLANILNNAFDSMKNSPVKNLFVHTRQEEGNICIEIEDTGEGIAEENMSKIFETYFSTKKNRSGSGFGLGLAISKNIIEKYKGEIKVSSQLKAGSKFTIILPRV